MYKPFSHMIDGLAIGDPSIELIRRATAPTRVVERVDLTWMAALSWANGDELVALFELYLDIIGIGGPLDLGCFWRTDQACPCATVRRPWTKDLPNQRKQAKTSGAWCAALHQAFRDHARKFVLVPNDSKLEIDIVPDEHWRDWPESTEHSREWVPRDTHDLMWMRTILRRMVIDNVPDDHARHLLDDDPLLRDTVYYQSDLAFASRALDFTYKPSHIIPLAIARYMASNPREIVVLPSGEDEDGLPKDLVSILHAVSWGGRFPLHEPSIRSEVVNALVNVMEKS